MKRPEAQFIAGAVFTVLLLLLFAPPVEGQSPYPHVVGKLPLGMKGPVRNIIFLIGDGMGHTAVSAARIKAVGATGMLQMDRMPIAGFVRTSSADRLIPDSAAASTAMATGYKTVNGVIGQTPEGDHLVTILEVCQALGKSTGLVATSPITHATPAGFASHVPARGDQARIAEQLLERRVNVLLGGGLAYFIPQSKAESRRKDGRNLLEEARNAGYDVFHKREAMLSADRGRMLGLFAPEGMATKPPEPSLAEMTAKAISALRKNDKGFFLMVEGSQIDWAIHEKNFDRTVKEVLDFDQAVGVALAFAEQSKKTLVVVTADHETGTLALNGGTIDGRQLEYNWCSTRHNPVTVPLYAFGPGAEKFSGFQDNTAIPVAMARLLNVKDFPRIVKKPNK